MESDKESDTKKDVIMSKKISTNVISHLSIINNVAKDANRTEMKIDNKVCKIVHADIEVGSWIIINNSNNTLILTHESKTSTVVIKSGYYSPLELVRVINNEIRYITDVKHEAITFSKGEYSIIKEAQKYLSGTLIATCFSNNVLINKLENWSPALSTVLVLVTNFGNIILKKNDSNHRSIMVLESPKIDKLTFSITTTDGTVIPFINCKFDIIYEIVD